MFVVKSVEVAHFTILLVTFALVLGLTFGHNRFYFGKEGAERLVIYRYEAAGEDDTHGIGRNPRPHLY